MPNNPWLSVKNHQPKNEWPYIVKCEDGYITSGIFSGGIWWVYDRRTHENHPTGSAGSGTAVEYFSSIPLHNLVEEMTYAAP